MVQKLTKGQLKSLKEQLLRDEAHAVETIQKLKEGDPFNDPDHVNDNAAIDTDVREQLGHDTIEAEINSLQKRVDLIHDALRRVEKGTYGLCEHSGEPIEYARLELVPEARYCAAHHKELVK